MKKAAAVMVSKSNHGVPPEKLPVVALLIPELWESLNWTTYIEPCFPLPDVLPSKVGYCSISVKQTIQLMILNIVHERREGTYRINS